MLIKKLGKGMVYMLCVHNLMSDEIRKSVPHFPHLKYFMTLKLQLTINVLLCCLDQVIKMERQEVEMKESGVGHARLSHF